MLARRVVVACLIFVSLAISSSIAHAQWPPGLQFKVGTGPGAFGLGDGQILPGDGPDDLYLLFGNYPGTGGVSWEAAHVDVHGFSMWAPDSEYLASSSGTSAQYGPPGFDPTGSGGYVLVYPSSGTVYKVIGASNGTQSAPVAIATSAANYPAAAARLPGGGAMVGWTQTPSTRLVLQHVDMSGNVVPPWPAAGWRAKGGTNSPPFLSLTADGAGGVIAAWATFSNVFVQRFSVADTVVMAGWPSTGGFALTPGGPTNVGYAVQLVPSDAQHWIAVWPNGADGSVVAQRFSLSGALDPAWPANGVAVRGPGGSIGNDLRAVPDGAGGLTVIWGESSDQTIRVRRVLVDGSFPGAYAAGPLAVQHGLFRRMGMAQGLAGGVCVLWWPALTSEIRARWLDGAGQTPNCAPNDTCSIVAVTKPGLSHMSGARGDGYGGAYFLYDIYAGAMGYYPLYISHINYLGSTTAVSLGTRPTTLALAVTPNPLRGALLARVTLPEARPARIELLDLAGRCVASRRVNGAGEHAERFDETSRLAPGVYLVSVVQGRARRTARAVVLN